LTPNQTPLILKILETPVSMAMTRGSTRMKAVDGQIDVWLDQARRGDREALGRLLERYRARLEAVARRELDAKLRIKESPSDLVQDAFAEAGRDLSGFRGTTLATFESWLLSVIHNRLENLRRIIEGPANGRSTTRLHVQRAPALCSTWSSFRATPRGRASGRGARSVPRRSGTPSTSCRTGINKSSSGARMKI
jgi:hypothetical protein